MTAVIDKVAWICIRDQRVLVARSRGKELYYLPGGKRESGESDTDTLVREVAEELSVRIKRETVSYIGVFTAEANGKADGIQVKMSCYSAEYEGELQAAAEIEEWAWFSYDERDRVSEVSRVILEKLHELELLS
ncbi:NUDIX hydrolase [Paenibacillus donghaensis]|uniref:DNA mismatch repair protein MutT n=1 Tax=Paenibacillus donghaensis TaxID=414771 RepID=A0A2Z2KNK1_9BACL|nr:NUDIX domain-containing protein [Paenibacillus donghaensis]ASA21691.1 DNA mismatch repair protein MutT [Paenibacillus donghaensis]